VIGQQQRLAQNRLPIAPWDPRIEIDLRSATSSLHRPQIFLECGHTRLPSFLIRGRFRRRPVSFRPFRGDMLCIAAELQNVPLAETHVFEQHPRSVREVRDFGSGELHRPVAHGVVEADVRTAAFQQVEQGDRGGTDRGIRIAIATPVFDRRCSMSFLVFVVFVHGLLRHSTILLYEGMGFEGGLAQLRRSSIRRLRDSYSLSGASPL
jgi:hypothetical protein